MLIGIYIALIIEIKYKMIKTQNLTKIFRTDEVETTGLNKGTFEIKKEKKEWKRYLNRCK